MFPSHQKSLRMSKYINLHHKMETFRSEWQHTAARGFLNSITTLYISRQNRGRSCHWQVKCSKCMKCFIVWMINRGPKNIFQGVKYFQWGISRICNKSSNWPSLWVVAFFFLTSSYCVQMKFVHLEVCAEATRHSIVIAKMDVALQLAYACL